MKIFILIVFLFATIRTMTNLADPKNHSIGTWLVCVTTVIAYAYLLMDYVSIDLS